jgi:hypothetical protein
MNFQKTVFTNMADDSANDTAAYFIPTFFNYRAVGFVFIFSSLLMLLTIIIFIVGTPMHRFVCEDGRTDRGKTVYPPPPSRSGGIKI